MTLMQQLSDLYTVSLSLLLSLSFSLYFCASQWERQPGEDAVRAAAGGGLPAGRAGGTAWLVAGAPETAGLAKTAEGGSGDAAGTSADGGPERVQQERARMAITQQTYTVTRDGSQASCLEFRSVTHVILLSAMHSDDILMKIEMIYIALLH